MLQKALKKTLMYHLDHQHPESGTPSEGSGPAAGLCSNPFDQSVSCLRKYLFKRRSSNILDAKATTVWKPNLHSSPGNIWHRKTNEKKGEKKNNFDFTFHALQHGLYLHPVLRWCFLSWSPACFRALLRGIFNSVFKKPPKYHES